uniref:Uncharacterized protein n=1 Tax=Arundo donax TaxID=35708 RepID=A0A0A8XTE8_ARUDO
MVSPRVTPSWTPCELGLGRGRRSR